MSVFCVGSGNIKQQYTWLESGGGLDALGAPDAPDAPDALGALGALGALDALGFPNDIIIGMAAAINGKEVARKKKMSFMVWYSVKCKVCPARRRMRSPAEDFHGTKTYTQTSLT